jgi:hypothetical protein
MAETRTRARSVTRTGTSNGTWTSTIAGQCKGNGDDVKTCEHCEKMRLV